MAIVKNDVSFLSSKFGVSFLGIGAGTDIIKTPDSTTRDFYIEMLQLACSSEISVEVFDGSTGTGVMTLSCASASAVSQLWDFRDEPMKLLNNDTTDSLCISVVGDGLYTGFVKGFIG